MMLHALLQDITFMYFAGVLAHYCVVLSEVSAERKHVVWPLQYFREKPYNTLWSFIGAFGTYALLIDQQGSPVMFFIAGYAPTQIFNKSAQIAHKAGSKTNAY